MYEYYHDPAEGQSFRIAGETAQAVTIREGFWACETVSNPVLVREIRYRFLVGDVHEITDSGWQWAVERFAAAAGSFSVGHNRPQLVPVA